MDEAFIMKAHIQKSNNFVQFLDKIHIQYEQTWQKVIKEVFGKQKSAEKNEKMCHKVTKKKKDSGKWWEVKDKLEAK